jgi:hypothetical protein
MDYSNLLYKFYAAVSDMAADPNTLQKRLYNVFISHLLALRPDEFPPKIKTEYEQMIKQVTRVEGSEGTLKATINIMSEAEAIEVTKKITRLWWEICNAALYKE